MAKLYFDASDTSLTISNSNTEVIGLSGTGVQSVTIAQDVTNVTLRQNVEKLVLNGASSAFKYQQAGATLKIYKTDGTTLVATVPVQGGSADIDGDGTLITFTNGTASAKLTSGVMSLGGTTVSTAIGDVTPTLTGGTTPITFSLDKDSYDVVEGQTLTFTIKASAPVQSATTVRYNIAGDKSVVGLEATAGTDFSPASASLSFASGESEKTVTITVPNDGVTEGFEGMKINLLSSTFSLLDTALATIEDGPELAKTMSLTTSGDSFLGTAKDDTFLGTLAMSSGGSLNYDSTTLNTSDTLTGGDGIDTLNISVRGNATSGGTLETPVPQLKGIEKVFISSDVTSNMGDGWFGVNLSNTDSSLTDIGVTSTYTNAASTAFFQLVPANVDVTLRGQGDMAIKYQSGVMAGASDTLDLTLSGVGQSATGLSTFGVVDGGVETLHITSSTSANYLMLNEGTGGSGRMQGLQKVTVDGSKDLYLDLNSDTGTGTGQVSLDANGFSGNLTVEGISTGAVTLTGGAGNDTFNFGSGFDAATGTSKDSLVGGDGVDTLQVTASVTDAQLKNVSSVEILYLAASGVTTGTLDATADAVGIVTVKEGTGATGNISLTVGTGFDNALTVQLYGTGADTVNASASPSALTVKGTLANLLGDTLTAGTGTGTTDVLSLTTDGSTGTLGANITNFEKIVLDGASSGLTLATHDANVASGATLTIDASAITSSTASFTFTGTAETDGKFSILGGAGNDTLYLGAGNDTVAAGDGADIIYGSGGGNDSLLGGAGNDTINMGSGLSSGDTIDGGDGADILQVSSSTVSSADFANVTGIETLKLAASAVTLSGNISFTTFDLTDTGSTTELTLASGYTNATTVQLGSGDAVVNAANVTLTGTLSESAFAAAGGNIAMTGGTGVDTLLLTTASGTTGELLLATGAKIDVITLVDGTGTGDAGADIRITATGYASSLRIDASELDAGGTGTGAEGTLDEVLYFNGSGASGAFTVLGGAGADQMTGGSGADSLNGGAGNDTLLGAAGNDTLLGNDGNDILISGTGNDSINGGAGNDRIILGDSTGGGIAGYLDNADTLNGGDGTDTLVVSASGTAFTFSYSNTSSIEVLELQGPGAGSTGTATLLSQAQTAGIATVKLGDHSSFSVSATSYTGSLTYDLNGNTGAVSLDGGAGDDVFLIKGTGVLALTDTLGGADGIDIIRLDNGTGAGTAVSVAIGDGVKKIERIEVADNSTGSAGATVTVSNDAFASGDTVVITASDLDATEAFSLTATGNTKAAFSVIGGAGNDTLSGGGKADTLSGGAGNDSLNGAAGNDTVNGGDGADTLVASDGNDTLTGGAGSDYFFFGSGSSTRDSDKIDTVADFTAGDKLMFDDIARTLTGGSLDLSSGLNKGTAGSIGDAAGMTTGAGQYVYISGSKQLAVDINGDGQLTAAGGDYMVILTDSTGIASADVLINFDVTLSAGVAATATGGAGIDTLIFSAGAGSTGTISGFESVVGSTGADTIVLGATGMSVTVVGSGGTDSITGSSGADTITLSGTNETGYLFGATGTGYDFSSGFGMSGQGADVINLGTGTSDNDTIVFGTGELTTASGADHTLTILNFDAGTSSDKLDLTQFDLTGFANTGGASGWFTLGGTGTNLNASGTTNSGDVVFVYGTGTLSSGAFDGSGASGDVLLSTGDYDNFVILASGSGDTTLDVYYVNASSDGNAASFSDNDIKLVGTISLISGDTAASIDSSNFSL